MYQEILFTANRLDSHTFYIYGGLWRHDSTLPLPVNVSVHLCPLLDLLPYYRGPGRLPAPVMIPRQSFEEAR